jgi:hypothetical protein
MNYLKFQLEKNATYHYTKVIRVNLTNVIINLNAYIVM